MRERCSNCALFARSRLLEINFPKSPLVEHCVRQLCDCLAFVRKKGFTRVKLCTASTLQTSRVLNKEIVTHMIGPCGANMLGNSYPRGVVNNVCMCHDVVDEKRERPLLTDSKLGNSYPRGVVNNVCMCHDVVDEKRERP